MVRFTKKPTERYFLEILNGICPSQLNNSGWGNPKDFTISERLDTTVPSPKLDEMQDIDLLRRYVAGEPEAFLALFHRYRKPVYNFIVRTIQDRNTAEDLLQEVFMRIIQRAEDFRGDCKFTTWLYTIARNLCIDQIRKTNLRRNVSLNGASKSIENGAKREAPVQVVDRRPGVDRHTNSKRLQEAIADAVGTLPEEQREVFLMRQLQNMPFQEIANVVGVSENTIKSRMRYALEHLRELLVDYEADARSLI